MDSILSPATDRLTVYIDPSKCMGCRACEMACAIEHSMSKTLFGAIQEKPKPKPRLKVVVADFFNVPMRCQHCEDAPCMKACPTGAISKTEEGFVVLNPNMCIGCLMCVMACPFGHPKYEPEYKVVLKCDSCVERIREGKLPACVEACPTGAMKFGRLSDILDEVRTEKAENLISGMKVPGMVYVKPIVEKKEEGPVKPMDLYRMYTSVRWY
ncbi:4Fe-4S dicluster domain-containing protein [Thermococcus sp. AM4]|uniref:4Fe-4S dicluster domain-containing protein n=1 Tax=Thermococcus sp. (strain AM4) TaxID=246969 RepID=UPI0002299685|nr:4Fe-4S dicluster domain-containing protein [Thermococcus sp. AM4]EEB72947.2 4Fe-4S cluster-binding protein CooF [Thermococcus sp. AM4]